MITPSNSKKVLHKEVKQSRARQEAVEESSEMPLPRPAPRLIERLRGQRSRLGRLVGRGTPPNQLRLHPLRSFVARLSLAAGLVLTSTGCLTGSYLFGSRGEKVEAKFRLADGPVLVFIDDVHERIDWPAARRFLWDDLSQELLRTQSATKVIPIETEDSLRRTVEDFNKFSAREIGEMTGADQVLWIEVQDFLADEQITDAAEAAYFAVTVKVLNTHEKESRSRVRLWPGSPEGESVTARMTGGAVLREKTKDAISRVLTAKLAVDIARLFHEHRTGE